MIKAYCDRCNKEIPDEYFVDIDVTTTGWIGNRDSNYYSKDFNATNATRRFILCSECLSKFNNMVCDFMYSQLEQKGEKE